MYVCVYVCMCVCMYVCMCMCVRHGIGDCMCCSRISVCCGDERRKFYGKSAYDESFGMVIIVCWKITGINGYNNNTATSDRNINNNNNNNNNNCSNINYNV